LVDGEKRYFSGICNRISQGERDENFTRYRMEVVPQFWLLTKRAQSRIFQQMTVPDILKKVLTGLDVTYEIQGTFHPRDFCVQYRETDFNFASRLMEEEGIFYFFKHNSDGHQMVVANTPQSHPDLPNTSKIIFEDVQGGNREEDRIYEWEKVQELRSGKYTLWDHCFELPHKHLEAEANILDSIQVGRVSHKLKVGGNEKLEIYDYPGEYAQRFDGIQPGGGDRAGDLQKIFQDNRRTTDIRIQEEAVPGLAIQGASNCRHFVSGYKFTLQKHFDADGLYVLTTLNHSAQQAAEYRSDGANFSYSNSFTCIPLAMPFRPQRLTPKPVVQGTQTAVVVGPAGEEIFTDKYGRVKVQFHWDREGKRDENSSCWIRVATLWAGKQWGIINIPRIGQEVIVDFLEGDADQPIIMGSVYNAEQMPANGLPDAKVISGLKTNTHKGKGYNEVSLDDTAKKEKITIHAQYDMGTTVQHDDTQTIINDRRITVDGIHHETIKKDTTILVTEGKETNTVKKEIDIKSETGHIHNWAATHIELWVGDSKLRMESNGDILLHGKNISIIGDVTIKESAPKVDISGGDEAKLGVGNQNITCDKTVTGISGAAINSSAKGKHEITGAVVKIN
jgi:type VI secretion system secreted protein VgrG